MSSLPFTGRRSSTVAATVAATPYRPQAHLHFFHQALAFTELIKKQQKYTPQHTLLYELSRFLLYEPTRFLLYEPSSCVCVCSGGA